MLILKSPYIKNGIVSALLLIPLGSQAFSGLTFYSTRLSWYACYNSKGNKLKNLAQILRQERVLFHKIFKQSIISPNQSEAFFNLAPNRKIFSSAKIVIPKKLAARIKRCEPVDYTVYAYSKNKIRVRKGLINTQAG